MGQPQKLLIKQPQCPGDVITLTSTIESLHRTYPGQYLTDVATTCMEIWDNNPRITKLDESECTIIHAQYNAINDLSRRDVSFMQAFCEDLGDKLKCPLVPRVTKPCLYLSKEEDVNPNLGKYIIINAGHKQDFPTKWAGTQLWQEVVDAFPNMKFIQVGERSHVHKPLIGVENLVGKTTLRELFRLVKYSLCCVGPISMLLPTAAAFDVPYVCLAGGREEQNWVAYSSTIFLHTLGQLPCCKEYACWKTRVVPVSGADNSVCSFSVIKNSNEITPGCYDIIGSVGVINAIKQLQRTSLLLRK